MDENTIQYLRKVFEEKETFVLVTHTGADGDAIGSTLALAHCLKAKGKHVSVYLPGSIAPNLKFIPGQEIVTTTIPSQRFDVMISVDMGNSKMLLDGDRHKWRQLSTMIVNIDHHEGNDSFGNINLIDLKAASVTEMLYNLFTFLKWDINKEVAICLLTGLIADTGCFKYPNTSASSFQVAAELKLKGADSAYIARELFSQKPFTTVKLLGLFYGSLQSDFKGKLVWGRLTREMFEQAKATDEEADKMVEELEQLKDVKIYILFRETKDGKVKVSFRSRDDIPVNKIASKFGGGGHRQAAGCIINIPLEKAEEIVLEETRRLITEIPLATMGL